MQHALNMYSTWIPLISLYNQPFYSYSSTLQQQFIATEQNRVHVISKTIL